MQNSSLPLKPWALSVVIVSSWIHHVEREREAAANVEHPRVAATAPGSEWVSVVVGGIYGFCSDDDDGCSNNRRERERGGFSRAFLVVHSLTTRWGSHLFRRFCNTFSKSPPACLGSMAAAVQPNSLWNFWKSGNTIQWYPKLGFRH